MLGQIDKFNNLQTPDIFLAQKNKHVVACLNGVSGLTIDCFLNDMNTCYFTVPRIFKNKLNNGYDDLETKMLILVIGFGWFEINVSIQTDGGYEMKNVSGKALEYELSGTNISIEANSADIDYEDYQVVQFYNITDQSRSLLHRVAKQCPGWSVGHVDESLKTLERSFSVEDVDAYSFLTGEVSQSFECFFIFNSYTREINAYKIDDYGIDTYIYLSFENLNQAVTVDIDDTKIKTVYKVSGGNDVYIEEVNPNGTDLIYNYSYYLKPKYMNQSTIDAYNAYQVAYDNAQPAYLQAISDINTAIDEILILNEQVPADLNSTDWSLYGLTLLNTKLLTYENTLNNQLNVGYGDKNSPYYNSTYLTTYNIITDIKFAIAIREANIASWETTKTIAQATKNAIQQTLSMANNYFTEEQWLDLSYHNYVTTYSNSNYIITDLDTDKTRIATELALLEAAKESLDKVARPQYSFSSTTKNLLQRKEFQHLLDDFNLGNYLRVEINENYIVKMRLISYSLNFDDLENINVEYSDMINVNNIIKDSQSILAQASATSNTVATGMPLWNKAVEQANYANQIRKEGLDASLIAITSSKDQDIVIDGRGITGRQWNGQNASYENEQFRLTKNLLAFTDDNWMSVKSAFGKIDIEGSSHYGLIGDAIVGNLFVGEKLKLSGSGAELDLTANNTITDMSTSIQANADGLLTKVSSGSIISEINQSAEEISISAEKINLIGAVTFSALAPTVTEGIQSTTDIEYYASTSNTSLVGGVWTTTAPLVTSGQYLWTRTKVSYLDGSVSYQPSEGGTCIAGAQGKDSYNVEISSSGGNMYKRGQEFSMTLSAYIYQGEIEVTDSIDSSRFRWIRTSIDTVGDSVWNNNHIGYKTIEITNQDVIGKSAFDCIIMEY